MKKYKTDEEREKAMQEAVEAIRGFLGYETSYAELMESAAMAQMRILELIRFCDAENKELINVEDITSFFYYAIRGLSLLRPFDEKE